MAPGTSTPRSSRSASSARPAGEIARAVADQRSAGAAGARAAARPAAAGWRAIARRSSGCSCAAKRRMEEQPAARGVEVGDQAERCARPGRAARPSRPRCGSRASRGGPRAACAGARPRWRAARPRDPRARRAPRGGAAAAAPATRTAPRSPRRDGRSWSSRRMAPWSRRGRRRAAPRAPPRRRSARRVDVGRRGADLVGERARDLERAISRRGLQRRRSHAVTRPILAAANAESRPRAALMKETAATYSPRARCPKYHRR